MDNDNAHQLIELLETERTLLVSGNIEAVSVLQTKKVELAELIDGEEPLNESLLLVLQQNLRRNQELFEASGRGLKAAAERISGIRRAVTQLDTYTASGSIQTHLASAMKVERRA